MLDTGSLQPGAFSRHWCGDRMFFESFHYNRCYFVRNMSDIGIVCACVSVDRVRHEDVVQQAGRGLQVPQGVRLRALIIRRFNFSEDY